MELKELGGYRLLRKLGAGGMGVVYLAQDGAGNYVALKALAPHIAGDDAARSRLAREVRTLRRVKHPRIAEVLDAELDAEQPFVVTEFVDGITLKQDVEDNGTFTEEELVHLGHALHDALSAVHAAGVIHRDLKPANVMMLDGEPVLIDFGIAQAADEVRITSTGLVMGTPGYMSPEISEGITATEATDWWGWGATLVYAATGNNPYGSGPLEAVLGRVVQGKANLEGVPELFAPLLNACLAPQQGQRPDAEMILRALASIETGEYTTSEQWLSSTSSGVSRAVGDIRVIEPETTVYIHDDPTQMIDEHVIDEHGNNDSTHVMNHDVSFPPQSGGTHVMPPVAPYKPHQPSQHLHAQPPRQVSQAEHSPPPPPPQYQTQPSHPSQQLYQLPQPAPPQPPHRSSSTGTFTSIAGVCVVIALGSIAPAVLLLLGYVWQLIARPVGSLAQRRDRHIAWYGTAPRSVLSAVGRFPWLVIVASFTSLFPLGLSAIGAVATGVLVYVGFGLPPLSFSEVYDSGGISDWLGVAGGIDQTLVLLSGSLVGALVLWLGPGSRKLRRGTVAIAGGIVRSRGGDGMFAGILSVACAGVLIAGFFGADITWWPLGMHGNGFFRLNQ